MNLLLDTNVLVDVRQGTRERHTATTEALDAFLADGAGLHICPQNLYELWVLATRPAEGNGLGLSPKDADGELQAVLEAFEILPEPDDLLSIWRRLCVHHCVIGKRAHDMRIAAFVLAHGLDGLITHDADIETCGIRVYRPQ